MHKFHFIHLLGLAFTLFGVVRSLAPPAIFDDRSIPILKGYTAYDCGYGTFSDSFHETCLFGVNAEKKSVESVKNFYSKQMADLGWREIPNSRHENPIDGKYTAFFLNNIIDDCQIERAITVYQNMYRGGVKLEDISIHFNEYLVGCKQTFPDALPDAITDASGEHISEGTEG